MLIRMIPRWTLQGLLMGTILLGGAQTSKAQILPRFKRSHDGKRCPEIIDYSKDCPKPGTPLPPVPDPTIPPPVTPPVDPTVPSPLDPSAFDLAAQTDLFVGGGRSLSATNYIDSAVPRSQIRFRFDATHDFPLPDRGEFFYPKCGCFRLGGLDPNADGPPLPETNIDSTQEYMSYLEYAFNQDLSAFVEIPIRAINPEQNVNTSGLGDINFGAKYAFVNCKDRVFTFQFRTYAPSGDGTKGLGTEHWSLEPALLFLYQLSDRWILEGELRDWIGIRGTDFTGNVLRYGAGLSYLLINCKSFRVQPIVEVVGWTFLDGMFFTPPNTVGDADGDTIVNVKGGIRFGFGELGDTGLLSQSDVSVSYGTAITNDELYGEIVRVEMRVRY